jgi:hypothetical protein
MSSSAHILGSWADGGVAAVVVSLLEVVVK